MTYTAFDLGTRLLQTRSPDDHFEDRVDDLLLGHRRFPSSWKPVHRVRSLAGAAALGTLLVGAGGGCKTGESVTDATADLAEAAVDQAAGAAADLARVVPPDPDPQYNTLVMYRRTSDFAGWTFSGAAVHDTPTGTAVQLAPSKATALTCATDEIDGGAAHYDAASGLCAGTDPKPTGLPAGVNYYNGGTFLYGTLRSPEIHPSQPINSVIASWNAATPPGTWIAVHVRALNQAGWSRWYSLPIWAADFSTVKRHSVKGSSDADGYVDTDTFLLKGGHTTAAYQLRLTLFATAAELTPTVRLVAAVASKDRTTYPQGIPDATVWGRDLPVPPRSQELPEYKGQGYGGGGEVWCSPTSTSMVMAYWGQTVGDQSLVRTVPETAAGCYDHVYNGTGNWPFNTAHTASLGLVGYVTRLYSLSDAEPFIKAAIPLIISIAFKPGELPGAPISQTAGHLIVLRGFDKNGDPIVNDPASANDSVVRRVYPRAALEKAWSHSGRTAYVNYPSGYAAPLPTIR